MDSIWFSLIKQTDDVYFLTSADKIRPFLETKANEFLSNNKTQHKQLINKIGHALHALNPIFKYVTFEENVQSLFKSLNFKQPIVFQGMYIFKQPFIGGESKI